MLKYGNCIIEQDQCPTWEAQNISRCVTPLITPESCGSQKMVTGLWQLYPGHESERDIHPDADEIYYVVSGEGTLVLDEEEYTVRQGMSVLIPANVHHQSFNNGDENLIYYYIFAPPPSGPTKQKAQGWVKLI
ncbi:MAG: cupin domain-containing protein [Gemmatimonadota bacterium]|nr:cupin domain-containing protein [Gemmatimonadota bacterium]